MPDSQGEQTVQGGDRRSLPEAAQVTYSAPDESIKMNKYHLMWVLNRMHARPPGPTLEQVAIPAILAVGLLVALLPADFKDYWGISAETWQAMVILAILVSGVLAVGLMFWWVYCTITNPRKTDVETYDDIISQMERDRSRLADRSQEPDTGDSESQ